MSNTTRLGGAPISGFSHIAKEFFEKRLNHAYGKGQIMLLDHHLGDVDCGEGRVVGEVERLLASAPAIKQAGELMPVSDWYDCLDTNTTAADAILD